MTPTRNTCSPLPSRHAKTIEGTSDSTITQQSLLELSELHLFRHQYPTLSQMWALTPFRLAVLPRYNRMNTIPFQCYRKIQTPTPCLICIHRMAPMLNHASTLLCPTSQANHSMQRLTVAEADTLKIAKFTLSLDGPALIETHCTVVFPPRSRGICDVQDVRNRFLKLFHREIPKRHLQMWQIPRDRGGNTTMQQVHRGTE